MAKLRIALAGLGRMGRAVFDEAMASTDFEIVAGVDSNNPGLAGLAYFQPQDLEQALAGCDLVIDFSSPEFAVQVAETAARLGKNFLIGTTAIPAEGMQRIEQAARDGNVSGMVAANFSVGVAAFFVVAQQAARLLASYDAEIVEAHHGAKRDAPSGTALRLAAAVRAQRPQGGGPKLHSIRAGQIVGEHSILFAGNNEVIEIRHSAISRQCFAAGCLACARWLAGRKDGRLHSVQDAIGT
ncbi:MAG: 4-hydroxy-tetrahydrodipicolinate reductase [Candidatus Aenigmarchaeota archaeon]|nr:4-hydroxy-tetrahydrodipicolinate reductase [Candidatus Aenigmarchaeota archaeon]